MKNLSSGVKKLTSVAAENYLQRDSETGILNVSAQTITRIIKNLGKADFNVNKVGGAQDPTIYRLNMIAESRSLVAEEFTYNEESKEYIYEEEHTVADLLTSGKLRNVLYVPKAKILLADVRLQNSVLLSGSFNPLHHGHELLLSCALEKVNPEDDGLGVFELSLSNAAKSTITDREIYTRAKKFDETEADHLLLLTNKPYFRDKVSFLSHNSWFCIGADTFRRFFDLQYYESQEQLNDFSTFLKQNGIHLIVGPRICDKVLEGVENYIQMVPEQYRSSVTEIDNFRVDVSSTAIRKLSV